MAKPADMMTENCAMFDVIVAPGFVLTEYAAVVDTLRIANRVSAQPVFDWTMRSARGGWVSSSSGAAVETQRFEDRPGADYLFVIGNSDQDTPDLALGAADPSGWQLEQAIHLRPTIGC